MKLRMDEGVMTYKIGDKINTWFSNQSDGISTVTAVRPYTGRYKEWFTQVVTLTAPRTQRGLLEMAI